MIKKLILGLLVLVVLALAAIGGYWIINKEHLQAEYQAFRKTGAPVLMYHGVGYESGVNWPPSLNMRPELFEEHIRYLKGQGYQIVTVEELAHRLEQGQSVDKYVALSFDDGYKNNFKIALPILQKYGAKGSFFVINKNIGKPDHMNSDEIRGMLAAGMEIGSHTTSHGPLAEIPEKYLAWELSSSRYYIKKEFDRYIVRSLAYPNGSYNKTVIEAAQKYGFYRALTGHIGVNTAETYKRAPMEMYRVTVADDGNGLKGFEKRLEDAYFYGFLQTKGLDVNSIRDLLVK